MSREIRVRKMDFDYSDVPRHWCGGDPVLTHAINALNITFPEGERFFVRSVRHYMDQIDDPDLKRRVAGFFGQEARHGLEHAGTIAMLEAQGYEVQSWLDWHHRMAYETVEPRNPPVMRLSVTVALEHLTATMGARALSDADEVAMAHPTMRHLLRWHAAEEIEHKSVAFDVLQAVDGRWWVRAAGMVMAISMFLMYWNSAMRHLLAQEPPELRTSTNRDSRLFLLKAVADYMRPGFHPDQQDDYHLAETYLRSVGQVNEAVS